MSAHYQSSCEGYDQDRQGGGGKRMKKRGASEYITKEHGSFDNRDEAPDPPKMSTAAQMARRKIATPKSRTGRATTPTLPSNPFQSQQQQPSAFSFGSDANQSFPPANASQSFQFSVPSTSSSFTFGQTQNEQPQLVSNPFAGINGTSSAFGSQQVVNDEMQDTSPEQPKPQSNMFNFAVSQPAPSAPTNGFSFGQSTAQQSTGPFGGLFGQQNSSSQASNTGLFGQSSSTQQNGFTPSFGQNNQSSAPSIFGQSATASAPAFTGFGASATPSTTSSPTFTFGQAAVSAPSQSQGNEAPAQSNKLFDFAQNQSDPTAALKSSPFSFGQVADTSAQSSAQSSPKPAFAGFGQTSSSQQPATTPSIGLFSGFGATAKQPESSTAQPSATVSTETQDTTAASDGSGEAQQKPKNAFASLFSPSRAASDTSSEGAKPVKFNFGQSASFTPAASISNASTSIFSKQTDLPPSVANSADQGQASTPDLSSAKSASETMFGPKPAASTPFGGLFNLNQPTQAQDTTTSSPAKPLFSSFTPQKPAAPASTPSSSIFNFGSKSVASSAPSDKPEASTNAVSPQKPALFQGGSTPAKMAESALSSFASPALLSAPSASNDRAHPLPKTPADTSNAQTSVDRAVSTEGPPQVPRYLSGARYKKYDENWRLKGLNRQFKDTLMSLDPTTQDFINIVQNYLDHREAIGEGLVGYERKKLTGSKRKAMDVDDLQEDDANNKRSKPTETSSAHEEAASTISTAPSGGSIFSASAPSKSFTGFPSAKTSDSQGTSASSVFSANTTSTPNFGFTPSKTADAQSSTTSNIFSANATPKSSAGFTPSKTVADTQTSNIFRSMIPGAAGSAAPSSSTSVFAPTKSTTPPSSPPKATAPQMPKFEVPKFGSGSTANFMGAFAKSSAENVKKFEQAAKEKRKAEEFDSDEDDEEEWNKKYEEEQRAKKAKIEAAAKTALAVPSFIPSASSSRSNSPFAWAQPVKSIEAHDSKSPEPSSQNAAGSSQSNAIDIETGDDTSGQESGNSGDDEEDRAEDDGQQEDEEDDDDEAEEIPDIPHKDSLFSRITGKSPANKTDQPILQPAANNTFGPGVMFGNIGNSTPEQPTFSPITPSTTNTSIMPKGDFVPTTKFNFTPAPATSSSQVFGSAFLGGTLKDGPIPGEGLFGSRPSTPSNSDANKSSFNFFGSSTSKQPADNTYKQGTPIKFGHNTNDSSAPSVEVTAATPPGRETPKPFSGLFGQSSNNTTSTNGPSLGFSFGASTSNTQPAPGFLGAASHLGSTSGLSSRATSPGMVSEAESVATDNTEDYSQEPQTSLMASNNGEENETVLFEAKAAISRMYKEEDIPEKSTLQKGWNKKGTGVMKVLKDKTSGKTRIVFRAEPSAAVILNTRLLKQGDYKAQTVGKNGAITFPVATEDGMQSWLVRVKTTEAANEAAKVLEANKGN